MNIKRLGIVLTTVFVFLVIVIGGYFTIKYNGKSKNNGESLSKINAENIAAQTASIVRNTVINEKTKIIIRNKYLKGEATTVETTEKVTPATLGLDKLGAEKYFKNKEYLMIEFKEGNVIAVKDIESWPVGYYVVKADNGIINVYKVDEKGELEYVKKADITLDDLPPQDRIEIEKGKSFLNIDLVTAMIEEYQS